MQCYGIQVSRLQTNKPTYYYTRGRLRASGYYYIAWLLVLYLQLVNILTACKVHRKLFNVMIFAVFLHHMYVVYMYIDWMWHGDALYTGLLTVTMVILRDVLVSWRHCWRRGREKVGEASEHFSRGTRPWRWVVSFLRWHYFYVPD